MYEIKPESAFNFTKFSVALICSWPPNKYANKQEKIIFEIRWWIAWINSVLLNIPLLYGAYNDHRDILLFTKSVCFSTSCLQITIKMLICRMMREKLQFVLDEMEFYIRDADTHERKAFLNYTKKYGIVNVISLFLATTTIIGFIMGPLILPQSFPTDAKYPFSVDTNPLRDIIYIQQSTVGIQVIAMTAIDCQMSMMLWCLVFRLKILQEQISKIKNAHEFSICIQKHQYLLWLASEVTNIVRYILLTTITMTTLSIIMGGVHIVGNQPMIEKMQFTFVVSAYTSLVFLNAWPSENLMRCCEGIGTAMYESDWIEGNFNKDILLVIQRSERPPVIAVAGFLPILSLNYYAKFLSKTFSFFTTLRIVLAKLETNNISST